MKHIVENFARTPKITPGPAAGQPKDGALAAGGGAALNIDQTKRPIGMIAGIRPIGR